MRDAIIIKLPRTISAPSNSVVAELNLLPALVAIFPAAGLGWRAQAWLAITATADVTQERTRDIWPVRASSHPSRRVLANSALKNVAK